MTDGPELPPLVLPPHPGVYLANVSALKEYLRARGATYFALSASQIALPVDLGEAAEFEIVVQWGLDSVRFFAVSGLEVPPERQAEVALFVQRLDARRGVRLWSVLPNLAAVHTVTRNHDDTLSSRVFEYGCALLRDALVRDWRVLRALLPAR